MIAGRKLFFLKFYALNIRAYICAVFKQGGSKKINPLRFAKRNVFKYKRFILFLIIAYSFSILLKIDFKYFIFPIEFGFLCALSLLILKEEYYRHHFVGAIFIITGSLAVFIILWEVLDKKKKSIKKE